MRVVIVKYVYKISIHSLFSVKQGSKLGLSLVQNPSLHKLLIVRYIQNLQKLIWWLRKMLTQTDLFPLQLQLLQFKI